MKGKEVKTEYITKVLRTLPDKPGVYRYYDKEDKILYVGKAKSLKKRVASYFVKDRHLYGKTAMLIRRIERIEITVVETEMDALLLENNLIKKLQPRYNVMLKDDKTYPWICIKNEPYPRVFTTRLLVKDGSQYFGPYASGRMMHTLLDLIKQLYPLRNCTLNLTESNIEKKKFKVCLEYHIGNCKGPCEGLQSKTDYDATIDDIREILKGNIGSVIGMLKGKMKEAAADLKFEMAHVLKEKITLLENYQSKSTIVSPTIHNVDVFSIVSDEDSAFVNFLKVVNGAIVQAYTMEMMKKLDEPHSELLGIAIAEIRLRYESTAKEIIVPELPDVELTGVSFHIPQRGDKKSLLDLSERNASYMKRDKEKQAELVDPDRHANRILDTMMKDLRLQERPKHIECFDNSNLGGEHAVAALTVFRDAKPAKKDYRHFNIRTVVGPDDFASMEEVVTRRYKRMIEEKQDLPQLIVIDGGKGQLSSAVKALSDLGIIDKVKVIGIAKRLEEIFFAGDPVPLYLDKRSETLKVIQNIRNEAHRFGITHHRGKREKALIRSELTDIKGISDKTAEKLLTEIGSVQKIMEASEEQIAEVVGKAKGKLVFNYFAGKSAAKEDGREDLGE